MMILPESSGNNPNLTGSELEQPNQRLLLELETPEQPEAKIKLRQQNRADGVGWFTQKTITLELAEAETLVSELESALVSAKLARSQLHHHKTAPRPEVEESLSEEAKVIKFPANRTVKREDSKAASLSTGENKLLKFKPRKR